MKLIAFAGFKGSGKDTAGRFLVENFGYTNFSFAESLKDACAAIFCWDREMLEGATGESRAWRETVDEWWANKLNIPNFTPRLALQLVGTNVFREHFNTDIWILNIERKINLLGPNAKVVLCDGRFPNELNLARKFGGKVIRVKRGTEPEWFEIARQANVGGVGPLRYKTEAREMMQNHFKIHESEWAWIGQPLDATIENDLSIKHLHQETLRYI
jgi:hypothetical protein